MNTEKSIFYFLHFPHSKIRIFFFILRFQFSHPFMLSNEFIFIYMPYKTECNLSSKDSTTTDDSIDYIACSSKCLNDLNNIELCSCHQNNEIGKEKNVFILAITVTLDMTVCRCSHVYIFLSDNEHCYSDDVFIQFHCFVNWCQNIVGGAVCDEVFLKVA
jgi:hypothetical protein